MKKKSNNDNLIAENRRARFNYEIEDTLECGIVLQGCEVKSIRDRHVGFADSYAMIKDHEVFVVGMRIEKYQQSSTHEDIDPERTRKLLLNRSEIKKLEKLYQQRKVSLVPLKLYVKKGVIKVLLGIGTGKRKIDKRDTIKDREAKIEMSRALKRG